MKKDIRFYLAACLLLSSIFISGCGRKEGPGRPAAGSDSLSGKGEKKTQGAAERVSPDFVKQKVLTFNLEGLTEKGAKKWDVSGESAESVTEDRIRLNNVTARSYGEGAEATIRGDVGIYDKTKNDVTLEKNVTATIENAEALSGQGQGPAGKGEKKRTVITCDGNAHFDYKNNQAYFDRNVKVVSDDGNIDADRITVYLDMTTKKVKEIVAEGNVKITRGENVTYSDKATYVEEEKKIVLTGRPKLVIVQEGEMRDFFLGKDAINPEKR